MDRVIEVNGRQYAVRRVGTSAHKATARVRDGVITMKIPVCWPREEGFKAALELENKVVAGLQKHPERLERAPLEFYDGQEAKVFGRKFKIRVQQGAGTRTSSARFNDGVVEVTVAQGLDGPTREKHASNLVRRVISKVLHPEVDARVRELNARHFGFAPRRVFIKDNLSNWGSCSENGNINLGFRLLLTPPEYLDYVAVHELAHLKEKGHTPEFWSLVESAVPDYKEKRRWLNHNGAKIVIAPLAQDLAGTDMGKQNGAADGRMQSEKDSGNQGGTVA